MLLGADTNFLIDVIKKEKSELDLWSAIENKQHELIISSITIGELALVSYRKGVPWKIDVAIGLLKSIPNIKIIAPDENVSILAAKYKHSFNLSFVDSLILATCVKEGCKKFITKDKDFRQVNVVEITEAKDI